MTTLSLMLTVLSFFTFWLVIPMFVLLPLAVFFACKAYRVRHRRNAGASRLQKLQWSVPILIPIAAFVLQMVILNTGYNA